MDQNLSDLRAQIAANEAGVKDLHKMVRDFGLATVVNYMGHVQVAAARRQAAAGGARESKGGRWDGGRCFQPPPSAPLAPASLS